jgi:hypothetical protein
LGQGINKLKEISPLAALGGCVRVISRAHSCFPELAGFEILKRDKLFIAVPHTLADIPFNIQCKIWRWHNSS